MEKLFGIVFITFVLICFAYVVFRAIKAKNRNIEIVNPIPSYDTDVYERNGITYTKFEVYISNELPTTDGIISKQKSIICAENSDFCTNHELISPDGEFSSHAVGIPIYVIYGEKYSTATANGSNYVKIESNCLNYNQ